MSYFFSGCLLGAPLGDPGRLLFLVQRGHDLDLFGVVPGSLFLVDDDVEHLVLGHIQRPLRPLFLDASGCAGIVAGAGTLGVAVILGHPAGDLDRPGLVGSKHERAHPKRESDENYDDLPHHDVDRTSRRYISGLASHLGFVSRPHFFGSSLCIFSMAFAVSGWFSITCLVMVMTTSSHVDAVSTWPQGPPSSRQVIDFITVLLKGTQQL